MNKNMNLYDTGIKIKFMENLRKLIGQLLNDTRLINDGYFMSSLNDAYNESFSNVDNSQMISRTFNKYDQLVRDIEEGLNK